MPDPEPMRDAAPSTLPPAPLPAGTVIDGYRLEQVASLSAAAVVYAATDMALGTRVAIKEYLPARLAARDAAGHVQPLQDGAYERGLQAFLGEARALARCDDACLLRVLRFAQSHGTGYRVMPWYHGRRLLDVRREMTAAPDERTLRILLDRLLDALDAFHATGQVHGAVAPGNILLLSDDRPLLLGPHWASRGGTSELVDTLMAAIRPVPGPREASVPRPAETLGPWTDMHALACVLRFCITGQLPAPAPDGLGPGAAGWPDGVHAAYSAGLLGAIDAASAADARARPQSVAQFRAWLEEMPAAAPEAAPAAARPHEIDSLIERVLQGMPDRVEAHAPPAPEPVWHETSPAAPEIEVASEPQAMAATADAPAMAPERPGTTVPRRSPAALLWMRHRVAVSSAALLLVAAIVWLAISMREAQHSLRIAWPPPTDTAAPAPLDRGALPAVSPASTLPALPSEPTAAGPAPSAATAAPDVLPPPQDTASAPSATAETASSPSKSRHASASHKADAKASPTGPRDLCSGRTASATTRCMQTQCAKPRWAGSAQCKQLRARQ